MTQWFAKATSDLRAAKALADFEEHFFEQTCFLAQQAAEKAIKGFLAFHKIRFDNTHDIEMLLNLVKTVNPLLTNSSIEGHELTVYAVRIRYPQQVDPKPLDEHDVTRALALADRIVAEFIKSVGS